MIKYKGEYNLSQGKKNIINHAKLKWSEQLEPYSTLYDDIYFNDNQGLNESDYVFFEGNNLKNRWADFKSSHFSIAETGFGTGLNFFNTALHFLQFKAQNHDSSLQRLHFISFEKHPLTVDDIKAALNKFPQFKNLMDVLIEQYPQPLIGCHRLSFNEGTILLDLWFGDINSQIEQMTKHSTGLINAWYLDGFNPSKNPEMWQQSLFEKMFVCSAKNASLATFTAAGFVRRALIAAGFNVSKRKGYGKKREMLVVNSDQTEPTVNLEKSDIAIIGGGISALCSALSLAKRGDNITIYCADSQLGQQASGNLQGALYPLLTQEHDQLSQLFSNAYLYALHFYQSLHQNFPFDHQFNGLIQLAYDPSSTKKLKKIEQANLPETLVTWRDKKTVNTLAGVRIDQEALYYPSGGWLSPRQLITSMTHYLSQLDNVAIHCDHKISHFEYINEKWELTDKYSQKSYQHKTVIIAAGINTLDFNQCRAIPLSAARGQVSHIPTNTVLSSLQRTLCHEGYITPSINNLHCMGASFKRHDLDTSFRQDEQTENLEKLKKCIPKQTWIESIEVNEKAFVATRCTTRDHFPYLGPLTDYDKLKKMTETDCVDPDNLEQFNNIYVFTGLGSRGLCTAPLLAETLASVIHNESMPIAKEIYEKMKVPRQWISYINKNKPLKA